MVQVQIHAGSVCHKTNYGDLYDKTKSLIEKMYQILKTSGIRYCGRSINNRPNRFENNPLSESITTNNLTRIIKVVYYKRDYMTLGQL